MNAVPEVVFSRATKAADGNIPRRGDGEAIDEVAALKHLAS